jgi:hypothetical protein
MIVYPRPVSMSLRFVLPLLAASLLVPSLANAHFVLQSPSAMTEQNVLGDPQKAPPCGDDGSAVATGAVTTYQAGETITITIDETIYHPGHYRVALAVNDPSELPDPPPVTPDNVSPCGSAPIDPAPVFPVLADGVLEHSADFGAPQTIQVTLPDDISCTNCTLQVIQFMTDHGLNDPGGCFYHHCATIAIEGGVNGGTTAGDDTGPSVTDDGMTTMPPDGSSGGAGSGDDAPSTNSAGNESSGSVGDDANSSGGGTAGPTDPGFTGEGDDGGSGCACDVRGGSHGLGALAFLLGLAPLFRRRSPRA